MGSEQSQIPGINIDEKVVEVSDFWTQHVAYIENTSRVSIFVGDLYVNEPFWSPLTPLEKFSKNILIYRHPFLLKYISSWQKTSKFYLAVEEVTPLSHMLSKTTSMEICLGLCSVLKALCFLHDKAMMSHNNVCLASIFVNKEGNWKLGGMEYVCRYKELSADYLSKSRKHRYVKAVDSNEDKNIKHCNNKMDFIDVYAFCMLVDTLLKNKEDADICKVTEFKEFCKDIVQNPDVTLRPNLKSILEHDFFKHKFISIHSYLIELPLKSESEKAEFFSNLRDQLETLNEKVVASQLGGLLVSRMVLMNETARSCLIPYLLIPKKDENQGLFAEEIFKQYISPKLLKIFCVRDAQIRLLLLEYFPHFLRCFSKEELENHILPELLVGIKDTNETLVAATLHVLADLVQVLGAETVIGGKRANLFKDNRPKSYNSSRKLSKILKQEVAQAETISPSTDQLSLSSSIAELIQNQSELPERPRPDGEEGETSTEEIEQSVDEENDNWGDWDNTEENNREHLTTVEDEQEKAQTREDSSLQINSNSVKKLSKILDITELDIKNQTKANMHDNEMDFFQDMEPVIDSCSTFSCEKATDNVISHKLSANTQDVSEEGWGDDWE